MYDYWEHIRLEENCDMTLELTEDCLTINMHECPSLSKVLDCDATPCKKYCDHCHGWVKPLINKAGFYLVYDIIDRKIPQCYLYIYKNKNDAEEKKKELKELKKLILF
jgi:cytochrome c2